MCEVCYQAATNPSFIVSLISMLFAWASMALSITLLFSRRASRWMFVRVGQVFGRIFRR